MCEEEPLLPPHRCPRLIGFSDHLDIARLVREIDLKVDLLWSVGEANPFNPRWSSYNGFAIYIVGRASEYWRQVNELYDDLCDLHLELNYVRNHGVELTAQLYPAGMETEGESDQLFLEPPLMGMLAGLGISLELLKPADD